MSDLAVFVQELLDEGRLRLRAAPAADRADDAVPILQEAYTLHALTVAGPPLPFDAETALTAARLLHRAAWLLLHPGESIGEAAALRMPAAPSRPEQHLSADLLLRYMPTLQRRARALLPSDEVTIALEQILRDWPLSGVLSDLKDAPRGALDFGGHAGLQLLYAERLARHERPAWFPAGASLARVELVWQALGRDPAQAVALGRVARELTEQHPHEGAP